MGDSGEGMPAWLGGLLMGVAAYAVYVVTAHTRAAAATETRTVAKREAQAALRLCERLLGTR